ncbi:AbrB/MazE/SpoVT family DNA-binding domain-containing protein [Rubrivirga litoralis]|uniref:AbrB/MazE/SpoVT family DNA-binding domain-containing protein n=1 Tax=Rubrivirga litoralis TaxID=3075598 RepID=UPI003D76C854
MSTIRDRATARKRPKRRVGTAVQVRDRGVVTLPKPLRERYGLGVGDVLDVLDLDGVFVLSPRASVVPELAAEIERLRLEAGYTTEELLESLRGERERYVRERYGDDFVDGLSVPDSDTGSTSSSSEA